MRARIFWTLLFLGVCISWLVLSYRPQSLAGVEMVFGAAITPLFLWLFVGCALLFVAIQAVLVVSVRTFPTRIDRNETTPKDDGAPRDRDAGDRDTGNRDIRILPGAEYFWTALPLLISLFFFWVVWQFLSM